MSEAHQQPKRVRRKKAEVRRLDPFFGISQGMVEQEAKYVGREVEDYCIQSFNELKRLLAERRITCMQVHGSLAESAALLKERERLALQCLLVRDIHHLYALYLSYVQAQIANGDISSAISANIENRVELPFSEWLFKDMQ